MSLLKTIEHNPSESPKESVADPEKLIEGNPQFKSWPFDSAKDDRVKTGVWQATPGLTRSIKGETFELCYVLEGVIELTPDGGEPVTYKAGDSFVMKPGYTGTWRTIETVKKIYVTVD